MEELQRRGQECDSHAYFETAEGILKMFTSDMRDATKLRR